MLKWQTIRDRCDIPERKYKLIRETLKNKIPSLNATNGLKNELNETFEVQKNSHGYYFNPVQKIKYVLTNLIEKGYIEGNKIIIKLAGDGTQLNKKHMKIFNLTFSVMNNPDIAYQNFFLGNYLIYFNLINQKYGYKFYF